MLFLKRLDEAELIQEKKANRLGQSVQDPLYALDQQHCRWSQFKQLQGDELLQVVRDEAFPFIKDMGAVSGAGAYARHMKDAVFLIVSPALLANAIAQIDNLLELLTQQAKASQDRSYVDLMGDLYEYMLSKLNTAGQNGHEMTVATRT